MPDTPARTFAFLLHDVARLMRTRFDQKARSIGMTRAQWAVLSKVERDEGIRQTDLACLLDLEPITVTRLLDKLATAGLIERRPDPADRRANRIYLTSRAQPVLRQMRTMGEAVLAELLADVSEERLHIVIEALTQVKARLADRDQQEPPATRKKVHA